MAFIKMDISVQGNNRLTDKERIIYSYLKLVLAPFRVFLLVDRVDVTVGVDHGLRGLLLGVPGGFLQ